MELWTIIGLLAICCGAVSVVYKAYATITETLPTNTGSASDSKRIVTHDQYDEGATLNSGTTPPVTLQASFLLTLTAGAATIDLRALVGTNGAVVDGNGLKVQICRIKNLGANIMTFKEGGSNGHNFFTATDGTIVHPGGFVMILSNDNTADIAAADKTWDVTGTGSQTAEVTIVVG